METEVNEETLNLALVTGDVDVICDVIEAVNTYTQANQIKRWYVLGRKETLSGEKRDKWRSWMFIKL